MTVRQVDPGKILQPAVAVTTAPGTYNPIPKNSGGALADKNTYVPLMVAVIGWWYAPGSTVTVLWEHRTNASSGNTKVYINGKAVGTEKTQSTPSTWTAVSDTITPTEFGLIEIAVWGKHNQSTGAGYSIQIQNFEIRIMS